MENSTNCPYCLSPIEDGAETVRCPICGVLHHEECWKINGKCSVYGCDGWQTWSSEITERIAPRLGEVRIGTGSAGGSPMAVEPTPLCMECGAPVKKGQLVCGNCRKMGRPAFWENCFGPSVVVLGGLIAMVALMLKGLL